jgi:hypothetical protein
MSKQTEERASIGSRWKLSLDAWAVTTALLIALLVRAGVVKHIPW